MAATDLCRVCGEPVGFKRSMYCSETCSLQGKGRVFIEGKLRRLSSYVPCRTCGTRYWREGGRDYYCKPECHPGWAERERKRVAREQKLAAAVVRPPPVAEVFSQEYRGVTVRWQLKKTITATGNKPVFRYALWVLVPGRKEYATTVDIVGHHLQFSEVESYLDTLITNLKGPTAKEVVAKMQQ